MIVKSLVNGIHSRSENLVKVTRDYDRGRATEDLLNTAFIQDAADLVNLEKRSGFAEITDGQLRWQDFIRPFSESISGLESGADLSRWFDTNSFYKRPKVVKKLSTNGSFITAYSDRNFEDSQEGTNRTIAIPGPYTLANLVDDQFYQSKEELIHDFSKALREIMKHLAQNGYSAIQINEPSLVYRYGSSASNHPKYLEAFLSAVKENFQNLEASLILHTYFGDCSKILNSLLSLPGISAVGIDFTETSIERISDTQFDGKSLGCGCVDGRSSFLESPEWIVEFCEHAIKSLKPGGLLILPSNDLKYLPRTYADNKVRAIGKAAETARKKFA